MRITIHVATLDEADEVRARYAESTDDVEIVVSQPVSPKPAERQERKMPS